MFIQKPLFKKFIKVSSGFILSLFALNLAFAQVSNQTYAIVGDGNNNGIRDEVDSAISDIVQRYTLDNAQLSAVRQIARSYEYVLMMKPSTSAMAADAIRRDVAATNCATSRLPSSAMDYVYATIEKAELNSSERVAIYNNYINLIDENSIPNDSGANPCEDQYSSNTGTNTGNTNTNSGSTNNGSTNTNNNTPTQKGTLPCLVLNHFMEYGSSDLQVIKLQTFLVLAGELTVWPTGYFGPNTDAAVKSFQARNGIDVKGWVGPSTRSKIAEITCNGDPEAMAMARKGVTVKKVSYTTTVKTQTSNSVVIATTSSQDSYTPPVYTDTSTALLSAKSGTFFTKRNPVNALYFTFKANVSRDDVYICLEKSGESICNDPEKYSIVKSKFEPGNFDSIANGDRWIFNMYYNSNQWGANGGKIYLKKGYSSIPEVYSVNVQNSL